MCIGLRHDIQKRLLELGGIAGRLAFDDRILQCLSGMSLDGKRTVEYFGQFGEQVFQENFCTSCSSEQSSLNSSLQVKNFNPQEVVGGYWVPLNQSPFFQQCIGRWQCASEGDVCLLPGRWNHLKNRRAF